MVSQGEIFQQDNARPHTARVAQDFLRHCQTLPWPARSNDLSPAEHVWDQQKQQMPLCHSVHDLELAVQDLWAHLPQDNIRCLINSMPEALRYYAEQSDMMASAVFADPTRALQGTNRWSGPATEESENDVGSLEQLLLYADEHYFAGKFRPGRPFRKGPTWGRRISST
ncbi:DDE_3 domain-containing protein [Trichonephila clavipes]|nr:DDE_3 domain-containing protein [Trichonephila clavipes]